MCLRHKPAGDVLSSGVSLQLLHSSGILEKVQCMSARIEAIRRQCSLFIVPLEEFLERAKELLRLQSDEQLKQVTRANGQVSYSRASIADNEPAELYAVN